MTRSRREFLKTAAATTTLSSIPLATAADTRDTAVSPAETLGLFDALPGDKALKIYAPAVGLKSGLLIQTNASKMLFVASAIKTFVLCEAFTRSIHPAL
jgi:beta-lactamase class A